jgi:hypothetical protein
VCQPDGRPVRPDYASAAFRALVRRAGLPPAIHVHTLRHSAASLLAAAGVPASDIAAQLGHKDGGQPPCTSMCTRWTRTSAAPPPSSTRSSRASSEEQHVRWVAIGLHGPGSLPAGAFADRQSSDASSRLSGGERIRVRTTASHHRASGLPHGRGVGWFEGRTPVGSGFRFPASSTGEGHLGRQCHASGPRGRPDPLGASGCRPAGRPGSRGHGRLGDGGRPPAAGCGAPRRRRRSSARLRRLG